MIETETITKTAAQFYDENSDFRALLAAWKKDKRCPIGMVDLLLEHGLDSQAEAARWAATTDDRPQYIGDELMGPMPCNGGNQMWWCVFVPSAPTFNHANVVPPEKIRHRCTGLTKWNPVSYVDMFLMLLDAWN